MSNFSLSGRPGLKRLRGNRFCYSERSSITVYAPVACLIAKLCKFADATAKIKNAASNERSSGTEPPVPEMTGEQSTSSLIGQKPTSFDDIRLSVFARPQVAYPILRVCRP